MNQPHLIIGIGELLWDLLPEGARLGGAPANFTLMAGRLGNHATILSRIGRDALGREAIAMLNELPVDASQVGVDAQHETGQVTVSLHQGEPSYQIHEPTAWDFLELTDEWVQLAERADALCFGSLAQRCRESRQTIQTLAAQTRSRCVRVFDANLRPPFYSGEIIQESLELATVVKLNEAELPLILGLLGMQASEAPNGAGQRQDAERLLEEFPTLEMVAITRGAHGSLLMKRGEWNEHPGCAVNVVDTVGTGDAFTAALTHYLLQGADLATLNQAANRWGSWVATKSGAMPALNSSILEEISNEIEAPAGR
ncbi:carbohydrate kinase family protein [Telmatobacter bradus]|uniref:carbohydrate kinase family protein n=1 Tax=Telmatobacter bradus TaxID=474953 RepID=UPI003B430BDF